MKKDTIQFQETKASRGFTITKADGEVGTVFINNTGEYTGAGIYAGYNQVYLEKIYEELRDTYAKICTPYANMVSSDYYGYQWSIMSYIFFIITILVCAVSYMDFSLEANWPVELGCLLVDASTVYLAFTQAVKSKKHKKEYEEECDKNNMELGD